MRKRLENQRYRTHPLVKAALFTSLFLAAAACAASYVFYRYVSVRAAEVKDIKERCAYEAYISLCENIGLRQTQAAADALSRCELFAECGETEALRLAIMSGSVDAEVADALRSGLERNTTSCVADAVRLADEAAKRTVAAGGAAVLGESTETRLPMWETLDRRIEISEEEAHRIAAEYVGGGATLTRVENHTFPLVYTYTCKNAAADVTRAGGRLLRMYVYRQGGAEEKGATACQRAAEDFLREAGIRGGMLLSQTENGSGYDYVFCGSFLLDGEEILCLDETIGVGVDSHGARICFFDAFEYYKNKPMSYDGAVIKYGRRTAAAALGVDDTYLSLVYTGGRLFWRLGGVKTLFFDAETGEIRVQNP